MRRIVHLNIFLCALLSLLCAIFVSFGQSWPRSEIIPELKICGGLPCYRGIVPGQTIWAKALEILKSIPNSEFVDEITVGSNYPGVLDLYLLKAGGAPERVIELGLNPGPQTVAMGDMVAWLGRPCCFVFVTDSYHGPHLLVKFQANPRVGAFIPLEQLGSFCNYTCTPDYAVPIRYGYMYGLVQSS